MSDFQELWNEKPWWKEGTTDKEMAEFYYKKGLEAKKEPSAQSPAAMAGSISLLREMKAELRAHISEHELDDGEELDTETEDLILGWIENFFENKIYDIEQKK